MRNTKKQPLTAAATLLALLVLTACGGGEGGPARPGSGDTGRPDSPGIPVAGTHWSVDSVTVDGKKRDAPTSAAYLEFTRDQVKGNFGCNHFTASAAIEGDTITIGDVGMTEMACEEPVQDFEDTLRATLTGKLRAELHSSGSEGSEGSEDAQHGDERLTLTATTGDTVTLSEQPAAPLVGTRWVVDSLLSGEVAGSLPVGTEGRAHLTIASDGSVRGHLGCNTFTGTATTDGDKLTFSRIATTRRLCDRPAGELEEQLLKTLRAGTVTYRIDHRTLTVTAPDQSGFAAQAPTE